MSKHLPGRRKVRVRAFQAKEQHVQKHCEGSVLWGKAVTFPVRPASLGFRERGEVRKCQCGRIPC